MAGVTEYRNEQFIKQYEHIEKLKLLSNAELAQVKRKRSFFEVSIKNSPDIKNYINYIKYELALTKNFRQMDFRNENDSKAIDMSLSIHVRDLFKLTLKKFQNNRKVWDHYLSFSKQKFPNQVTSIYREMLNFHHETEDYIEAAQHEVSKNNYLVAMNLIVQGIAIQKDSCQKLVIFYIECSLKQGSFQDDEAKMATLLQAEKFYEKFLKTSDDVSIHCELLRNIQTYDYSLNFQNNVLSHLMQTFSNRAAVWEVLALRHLSGLVYEISDDKEKVIAVSEESKKMPIDVCLRHAVAIYEKSLDVVDDLDKEKMFTIYINQMIKLDDSKAISASSKRLVRKSLGKALTRGYEEDKLSEVHFICFLKLLLFNLEKNQKQIEEMLEKGAALYPHSMKLFEIAVRYRINTNDFSSITQVFHRAVNSNMKSSVELQRFLCEVYLSNAEKEKASEVMLNAVNSRDNKLSEAFQPLYIEYCALTEGIEIARDAYKSLLASKTLSSLSLDVFVMMIKLEETQPKANDKLIADCYERATEHFGRLSPDVSKNFLDYLTFD